MRGESIHTIEKPESDNLTDILEYHQLYDLQVDIKLSNHIDKIKTTTQELIEEIVNSKKNIKQY